MANAETTNHGAKVRGLSRRRVKTAVGSCSTLKTSSTASMGSPEERAQYDTRQKTGWGGLGRLGKARAGCSVATFPILPNLPNLLQPASLHGGAGNRTPPTPGPRDPP